LGRALTARERQIVALIVARGLSDKQIARELSEASPSAWID
jgi:DNA-binding NarL/FixJ family response regulator